MRELHHRMRNLFATVGAIISLSRHAARDVDDYVERISSRLDALNRAQNVLLGANFMTGSMHALLREVEQAFRASAGRVRTCCCPKMHLSRWPCCSTNLRPMR